MGEAEKYLESAVKDRQVSASRVFKFGDDSGKVDIETEFNMADPMARDFVEKLKAREAAKYKPFMSAPGALGLPPLLEEARLQYDITDAYFEDAPLFDTVVVFQVRKHQSGALSEGGLVIAPGNTLEQEQLTSTIGIICSAGLVGLDYLRSHGVDLGHRVIFTRMALYRPVMQVIDGNEERCILVHAADIRTSKTLQQELRSGQKKVVKVLEGDYWRHRIMDAEGVTWTPQEPIPTPDGQNS
jgi:hypothetical protein